MYFKYFSKHFCDTLTFHIYHLCGVCVCVHTQMLKATSPVRSLKLAKCF